METGHAPCFLAVLQAGVISLLNDMRLNAGLPPLGLVNPLFYSLAASNPGMLHGGLPSFAPLSHPHADLPPCVDKLRV